MATRIHESPSYLGRVAVETVVKSNDGSMLEFIVEFPEVSQSLTVDCARKSTSPFTGAFSTPIARRVFCRLVATNRGRSTAHECQAYVVAVDPAPDLNHNRSLGKPDVLKWAHETTYSPITIEPSESRKFALLLVYDGAPNTLQLFFEPSVNLWRSRPSTMSQRSCGPPAIRVPHQWPQPADHGRYPSISAIIQHAPIASTDVLKHPRELASVVTTGCRPDECCRGWNGSVTKTGFGTNAFESL